MIGSTRPDQRSRGASRKPAAAWRGLRQLRSRSCAIAILFAVCLPGPVWAGLSPEQESGLRQAKYVYIQSTRKDGSLSKSAEIWFLQHDGAVYVGTRPTSWRAKRIRAGRTAARIAIGKVDGPSFAATGSIVKEPATEKLLLETFATKYADGWPKYEKEFRAGFADGSRILIKYTPR